jgi:hypothetical protein
VQSGGSGSLAVAHSQAAEIAHKQHSGTSRLVCADIGSVAERSTWLLERQRGHVGADEELPLVAQSGNVSTFSTACPAISHLGEPGHPIDAAWR